MVSLPSLQVIIQQSPHSVSETVDRLEKEIRAKGMAIFSKIDHAKEARAVNMDLREEVVLIVGDPKVGTFLMQEQPLIGLELPLRFMVWHQEDKTQIAYIDPLSLGKAYGIIQQAPTLQKISDGLSSLVAAVIR